jgi:hypothetical protein
MGNRHPPQAGIQRLAGYELQGKVTANPNLTLSREERYQNINAKAQSRKDFFGLLWRYLAIPPFLSRKSQKLGGLAALR